MAATQQGVVMAASPLGKLKTIVQVITVLCLIAVHGHPAWVTLLVYLTVAITVFSGADYFFGLRRRISELDRTRADRAGA
jgi:CDP-diacylglycerol--glycerol-3-phosphate 3-phosphatidyltransferase